MEKAYIQKNIKNVLEATEFENLGVKKKGKVRDVYAQDEKMILVTTDRYSAFDRNLALIPFKGQVLTGISNFWFQATKDIIQNHLLESPDPNVVVAKKCVVIPIEVVVRGYITGVTNTSLWTKYSEGERDFGSFTLPEGLKKNQKLEHPVITPTTKDEKHDRPITAKEIVNEGIVGDELWAEIEKKAIELFTFGQKLAAERGLILVDTKYEFGITPESTLMLIDEVHTPDSSRYWHLGSYEERFAAGEEPEYFDKEFLRLWFKEHSDPYKDETLPQAPEELIVELASRYIKIYEEITGQAFPVDETPIRERIEKNLERFKIAG